MDGEPAVRRFDAGLTADSPSLLGLHLLRLRARG